MPIRREKLVDERGLLIRHIPHTEAKKMHSTGEAVKVCKRCEKVPTKKYCGAHGLLHDLVYQITSLFRNTRQSPAYLTLGDMKANVGEVGEGREGSIPWAVNKVQAWPHIHDTLAVCVGPRLA